MRRLVVNDCPRQPQRSAYGLSTAGFDIFRFASSAIDAAIYDVCYWQTSRLDFVNPKLFGSTAPNAEI